MEWRVEPGESKDSLGFQWMLLRDGFLKPVEGTVVYPMMFFGIQHHPNGGWDWWLGFLKHQTLGINRHSVIASLVSDMSNVWRSWNSNGLYYTPGSTNMAGNGKWTRIESMNFLLNMGIFQPAMLVYQRVLDLSIFVLWFFGGSWFLGHSQISRDSRGLVYYPESNTPKKIPMYHVVIYVDMATDNLIPHL